MAPFRLRATGQPSAWAVSARFDTLGTGHEGIVRLLGAGIVRFDTALAVADGDRCPMMPAARPRSGTESSESAVR